MNWWLVKCSPERIKVNRNFRVTDYSLCALTSTVVLVTPLVFIPVLIIGLFHNEFSFQHLITFHIYTLLISLSLCDTVTVLVCVYHFYFLPLYFLIFQIVAALLSQSWICLTWECNVHWWWHFKLSFINNALSLPIASNPRQPITNHCNGFILVSAL